MLGDRGGNCKMALMWSWCEPELWTSCQQIEKTHWRADMRTTWNLRSASPLKGFPRLCQLGVGQNWSLLLPHFFEATPGRLRFFIEEDSGTRGELESLRHFGAGGLGGHEQQSLRGESKSYLKQTCLWESSWKLGEYCKTLFFERAWLSTQ